ncbi:MAG: hypothetical protein Rubg2KO_12660 [Rubricoccaceae bacterium]
MLTLSNDTLTVSLLDPASPTDRQRVGTRYCWGGYIWQVEDATVGPLLTGPEWPEPSPDPYNGQGLPESFRSHEFGTDRPLHIENGRGFILGVGDVAETRAGDLEVTAPCDWEVTSEEGQMVFTTEQSGHGYACRLGRWIRLGDRSIVSYSVLENLGERPLPLHWFAHPFFALTDGQITCDLPASWSMDANEGFALDAVNRLSLQRKFRDTTDGHFQHLHVGDSMLTAILSHPTLDRVTFTTDFIPDLCPVWGNSATWSIEPYLMTEVAPGEMHTWGLTYHFGPVTG